MPLQFAEPPSGPRFRGPSSVRQQQILDEIEELKTRPGEWAIVVELDTNRGSAAAHSKKKGYTNRGCEAKVIHDPHGHYTIYARWPDSTS